MLRTDLIYLPLKFLGCVCNLMILLSKQNLSGDDGLSLFLDKTKITYLYTVL